LKIKEYIKELLFTNQGVIIPGLGGFVSEYEPAAFDVNENKFLPPSKKIFFKAEYNYPDNLLSEFICKKEKISADEAKKQIEDFVKDCGLKLDNGIQIDFPGIGVISRLGKALSFKQSKETNLLTDSFGLQSIKAKPIEKNQQATKTTVSSVKKKKSYKKPILISSALLVLLVLIAFSWYITNGFTNFNLFIADSGIQNLQDKPNDYTPAKYLDSIAKVDSIKALINESIDEKTDLKDALFYEQPPKEDPKPKYSSFHIVAGSFKRMENAEKFSSELKMKGYNPKIIQSGDTLFRIAIYTFTSETEALTELYKLRQSSDIKSVWILKSI
jgi:hypothetical protein